MVVERPWYGEFFIAGGSAVGAIIFTNPIDVAKTKMTLQSHTSSSPMGNNPFSVLMSIGRTEGLAGLQRGLTASCFWQFSNVSVRFGVYASAKKLTGISTGDASPFVKWLQSLGLAGISGGMAAVASNPFFIIKTRFQALEPPSSVSGGTSGGVSGGVSGASSGASGGVSGALLSIWRADGVSGLFRGLSAFAPRVIVASAVQLSTYDAVKELLIRRLGLREGDTVGSRLPLVVASSFVTGLAVVLAMQPFDFAATRLVSTKSAAEAGQPAAFSGPFDVIRQTVRTEGVIGLYRGAAANCAPSPRLKLASPGIDPHHPPPPLTGY